MQASNLATPITKLTVMADNAPMLGDQFAEHLGSLFGATVNQRNDSYTSNDLDSYLLIDGFESAKSFLVSHPLLFGSALMTDEFDPDIAIESVLDSSRLLKLTRWLYAQESQAKSFDVELIDQELIELGFSPDHDDDGELSLSFVYYADGSMSIEIESTHSPYTELLCSFIAGETYPGAPKSFRYAQDNNWLYRYWDYLAIWFD